MGVGAIKSLCKRMVPVCKHMGTAREGWGGGGGGNVGGRCFKIRG